MLDRFVAIWVLDPETSKYGDRPAPTSGVYTIVGDAEQLWFHVRWSDGEQVQQAGFYAVPDGQPHPLQEGMTLTTTLDGGVLSSVLTTEDGEAHRASRTVSDDGGTLTVVQQFRMPGGNWERTEAVYHRSSAKQVIVYRRDLKMRKGKIAAQCAHASLAVFFRRDTRESLNELHIPMDGPMANWSRGRFAKVVLSVEGEAELLQIHAEAQRRGLPTSLITDAGKTEFHGVPTKTTVAIGPAAIEEIDPITGREGLVQTKLA